MLSFSIITDTHTRADKILSALFEGVYSRSQIQKGFDIGQITIRNKKEDYTKSHHSPKYYLRR